jgi:hypothetical protein
MVGFPRGARAIRAAMQRAPGDRGAPTFTVIDRSGYDTLPAFFADSGRPEDGSNPQEFDLIAVDGAHSRLFAWWDLLDLSPRVRVGGALVFDDLEQCGRRRRGTA